MNFYFYSPVAFEKWDWRNSVEKGIGGSETSHVEMAWRLAARGHKVTTYAPIPEDCPGQWKNTKWLPLEKATFKEAGVWILYRCPEVVDKFNHKRKDQQLWLMMQDWDYPQWDGKDGERRIKNTDAIITLCKSHGRDILKKHPTIKKAKNLWLTSNGVKLDLIKEIESEGLPKRDFKKIIYTSSPDRGLKPLLISFRKAREIVPDLQLYAFYGFNNLDKLTQKTPNSPLAQNAKETKKLLKQPGVHWMGRISQKELYKQWFSAGIWVYQTNFNETSCISSMEAQSCGAIPIFSPKYALSENVRHGICIDGDANDPLTNARFAAEIVRLATTPQFQETIRTPMMADARERFDWENFVTQWECKAEGRKYGKEFPTQL